MPRWKSRIAGCVVKSAGVPVATEDIGLSSELNGVCRTSVNRAELLKLTGGY